MKKTRKNSKVKAKKKKDAGLGDQQASIANVNNSHANMHNKSKRVLETQILEELPAKKVAKGTVQVKSKVVVPLTSINLQKLSKQPKQLVQSEKGKHVEHLHFDEGEVTVHMEFEVGKNAAHEFASDQEDDYDTESSDSDGAIVSKRESYSQLESGEIEELDYATPQDSQNSDDDFAEPQPQTSSQDSNRSSVSKKIKHKQCADRRDSMEQKLDTLSSSVHALQQMLLKQQERESDNNKKKKEGKTDRKQGKTDLLSSNSETMIYHNALNKISECDQGDQGSTIQVDDEIAFHKDRVKNRDSSSSEDKMDTSDEMFEAGMEVVINDIND